MIALCCRFFLFRSVSLEIPLFERVWIRWRAARGKRERRRKKRSSSPSFKNWFFFKEISFFWKMAVKLCFLVLLAVLVRVCVGGEGRHYDSTIIGYSPDDLSSDERLLDLFHSWLQKNSRSYHSVSEKNQRFMIFKENLRYIHSQNVQEKSYWLGLNNFSDLSHEEFQVRYLGTRPRLVGDRKLRRKTIQEGFIYADVEAPASIDWREKGAVAEVKDQGSCGESSLLVLFLHVPG